VKLYKKLQNPALLKAVSHPLRAKILSVLQEEEASPKELATYLGAPLANVAYHVKVLCTLKLIRLVRTTRRRGAIEHYYKALAAPHIEDEAWSQTPDVIKGAVVASALEQVGADVNRAASIGGFNRSNAHLTRTNVVLDAEAWDVLADRLLEVMDLAAQLEAQSERRLRCADHEGERHAGLVMMLFESLPGLAGGGHLERAGSRGDVERHGPGQRSTRK
jgi:DNA-binding transcriptional ArsR family regulator